jgi:hypothetical protein
MVIMIKIMFFRNVMMFNLIARNLLPPSSGQKMKAAVSSRTEDYIPITYCFDNLKSDKCLFFV